MPAAGTQFTRGHRQTEETGKLTHTGKPFPGSTPKKEFYGMVPHISEGQWRAHLQPRSGERQKHSSRDLSPVSSSALRTPSTPAPGAPRSLLGEGFKAMS